MTIYRCDSCNLEMNAQVTANTWHRLPQGWTGTKFLVPGSRHQLQLHFCSLECIKKFDGDEYASRWRAGLLDIKRRKS